jgi:hypothetical protein
MLSFALSLTRVSTPRPISAFDFIE